MIHLLPLLTTETAPGCLSLPLYTLHNFVAPRLDATLEADGPRVEPIREVPTVRQNIPVPAVLLWEDIESPQDSGNVHEH